MILTSGYTRYLSTFGLTKERVMQYLFEGVLPEGCLLMSHLGSQVVSCQYCPGVSSSLILI